MLQPGKFWFQRGSNPGFGGPFRKFEGGFGTRCPESGVSSVRAIFLAPAEADLPPFFRPWDEQSDESQSPERFVSAYSTQTENVV